VDLTFIAWALVVEAPISIGAAAFLWKLHAKSRHVDTREPKPLLRLSLILSITGTMGAAVSLLLGIAAVLYLVEGGAGIVRQLGLVVNAMFPVLGLVSIINALYLWWLERHPEEETIIMTKSNGSDGEPLDPGG
jgi:hypothetical protein